MDARVTSNWFDRLYTGAQLSNVSDWIEDDRNYGTGRM